MLKLKRFTEGVWCDVPERIAAGVSFKIRPIHAKQYLSLKESCKKTKMAVAGSDGNMQITDDYDEAKLFWLTFSYMLQEWKGIEVEGAASDDEIREEIFNRAPLRDFINEMANKLLAKEETRFEEELKNSERSPSG